MNIKQKIARLKQQIRLRETAAPSMSWKDSSRLPARRGSRPGLKSALLPRT